MAVTLKCKCGASLTVTVAMAGRMGTCPKCGRTMRIPKEAAKVAVPPAVEKKPAAAEPPAAKPAHPPAARPAPVRPQPNGTEAPPVHEPIIEAAPAMPGEAEVEAAPVEPVPAAAEVVPEKTGEEAPLYLVNIRWPKSRVPLIVGIVCIVVLAGIIAAAFILMPALKRQKAEDARRLLEETAEENYVNKTYGYGLRIKPPWKREEGGSDEKVVVRGKRDPAEIDFEIKPGSTDTTAFLKSLSDEASKEPGFQKEAEWGKDSTLNQQPNYFQYRYSEGGKGYRVVLRVFKLGDRWMVVTFRAPLEDYQRIEQQFEELYASFAPQ